VTLKSRFGRGKKMYALKVRGVTNERNYWGEEKGQHDNMYDTWSV